MSHPIFKTSFASVYPYYVAKAEKKDRTKAQVDELIHWLTGYDAEGLEMALADERDFEAFFDQAPALNPHRTLIKGVVCGIRVEDMEPGLMQEIRYLDKLIDELARGKKFENIMRSPA